MPCTATYLSVGSIVTRNLLLVLFVEADVDLPRTKLVPLVSANKSLFCASVAP